MTAVAGKRSSLISAHLPDIGDIRAAAGRIAGHAVVTPLLESPALNALSGGRILIKAEPLQRTGSFKFRGAFNRLSQLDGAARRRGVVAYSSGNHAQAVAEAARILEVPAVIVMPADAPGVKLDRTRRAGAEIVTYDRPKESQGENREQIAQGLAAERGAVLVPPFDDAMIIAGQGTLGLELAGQAAAAGADLDAVLVPAGGGGLAAGCVLALEAECPAAAVYTVEPRGFDDWARSLAAGERLAAEEPGETICDALMVRRPGALAFAINAGRLAGGLVVADDDTKRAMAAAFAELKVVTEPGGAVALAAALAGGFDCRGRTVAVVLSGGNVDAENFAEILRWAGPEGN